MKTCPFYTRRPKLTFPGFQATPERQHPKRDPRPDETGMYWDFYT